MSNNKSSSNGNYGSVTRLAAFWALLLSAIAELVYFVLRLLKVNSSVPGTLNFIGNIMLIIAIGLAAWDYVKGKKRVWRILFIVALIVLIVFRVLNYGNVVLNWFK